MEDCGRWYVIQALSGQERKAAESILKRLEQEEMEAYVFEVMVPMEKVTEVKLGKKTTTDRKFFPGYILLRADLYDENHQIRQLVWSFIKDTSGVIGFIGGDSPSPLSDQEVQDIMDQLHRSEEVTKPKIEFEEGEMVKIRDGAFANFEGMIESIDPDRGKLKLSVLIFGRATPVEVEYWQVERS